MRVVPPSDPSSNRCRVCKQIKEKHLIKMITSFSSSHDKYNKKKHTGRREEIACLGKNNRTTPIYLSNEKSYIFHPSLSLMIHLNVH